MLGSEVVPTDGKIDMQASQVPGTQRRRSSLRSAGSSAVSSGTVRPYTCFQRPTPLRGLIRSGKKCRSAFRAWALVSLHHHHIKDSQTHMCLPKHGGFSGSTVRTHFSDNSNLRAKAQHCLYSRGEKCEKVRASDATSFTTMRR